MITEILITTKAFEKRSKVIVFNEKGQIVGHTYSEEVGEILDYSDKNIVCRKEGKLCVYDESFRMVNYNYECAVGKFKKIVGPHLICHKMSRRVCVYNLNFDKISGAFARSSTTSSSRARTRSPGA